MLLGDKAIIKTNILLSIMNVFYYFNEVTSITWLSFSMF